MAAVGDQRVVVAVEVAGLVAACGPVAIMTEAAAVVVDVGAEELGSVVDTTGTSLASPERW